MHSHEHASLNIFLFNDRLEHVCLEELCLITCLLESFNDYVSVLPKTTRCVHTPSSISFLIHVDIGQPFSQIN